MRLIIGGAYQGKLDYVFTRYGVLAEDVYYGVSSNITDLCQKAVIKDFHLLIKNLLQNNSYKEVYASFQRCNKTDDDFQNKEIKVDKLPVFIDIIDHIVSENPDVIIISDEIGNGIVPMDAMEREHRELVGRLCCHLAKKADEVIRVFCGIGTVIKAEQRQES